MKPSAKVVVVLLVLLLELAWTVRPRFSAHGPVLEESYRRQERLAALAAWSRDQTPAAKAAYDTEGTLLDQHIDRREHFVFAAALAINAAAIYSFWRYAPKKRMA
jgi:hypothetical protein